MLPPIYETERFTLKPYEFIDEARFIEMGADKFTKKFMGDDSTNEISELKLFNNIFKVYKREEKRWFWIWGIYEENKLVGHLELKETENTSDGELEIVYMVHPDERRKGVMKEVLHFVKNNQNDWNRNIIATVDKDNLVSISQLEKWGVKHKETVLDEQENDEYFKLYLS